MIFLNTAEGDILEIDATLQEDTRSELVVTEQPVEFGADINDHSYLKPKVYTFIGGVSNSVFRPVTNDITNRSYGTTLTRAQTAWAVLQALQASGQPFDVQTGLELISQVLIKELTSSRDKRSANTLIFNCTVQQILTVQTRETILPEQLLNDAIKNQGSSTDKGSQQGEDVTNESFLSSLSKLFNF